MEFLVDITMTAVRRPELLKQTLHSFYMHLFEPIIDQCRLVINVDPIGDNMPSWHMIDILSGYFKNYHINMPSSPSFPIAFQWCWSQVNAQWVFNLEDDWTLLEPVDIVEMIEMMGKEPDLASLRLPFFRSTENSMKNWNLHFPWNERYFECPDNLRKTAGFAGHPSLLRGDFVRKCSPLINPRLNPEKQFHGDNDNLVAEVLNWRYGVFGKPNSPKVLNDIGALWKTENKFQKSGSKAFFTQWEKSK